MAIDDILSSLIANDLSRTLQLDTSDGWRPSFTGIVLSFDGGEVELAYPALNGPDTLISTPFAGPFLADTKYFFGFRVFIERGAYFSNPALTNVNQSWNSASNAEAWQLIGTTFDVPDPANAVVEFVMRFDVNDVRRRVFMSDFVLYQLTDYSHYVRVKLIGPDRNSGPNVGTAQVSLNDQYQFTFGGLGAVSFVGFWSDWLELPGPLSVAPTTSLFAGRFKFRDRATLVELLQVQSAFEVAVGPKGGHGDQAQTLLYDIRSAQHGHFVLNLPGPALSLLDLDQVRFLTDVLRQDIANTGLASLPKVSSPSQYWLGMFFPNTTFEYDTSGDFAALYALFRDLGLNALDYGPAVVDAPLTLGQGFSGAVYYFRILGDSDIASLILSYKLPAIQAALLGKAIGWVGSPDGNDIDALFKAKPDRVVINVNDEPAGLALAGPDYTAAFQDYLRSLTLNPSDFGVTDFGQLDALPRTPLPTSPSAIDGHLFYWRNRFWSEANAEVYRAYRHAVTSNPQWGGSYHFTFNYGDLTNLPHTYHNGMEVLTFARHGSISLLWIGMGFTSTLADYIHWEQGLPTTQQFMSLVADYALAVTRSAHIPCGFYLRTGEPTLRRLDYYLFNAAARGVTYFDYYGYGPGPTYDGIGGSDEATVGIFRQVAHASQLLARCERFLFGASRRRARIALLAAQTEPLWNFEGAAAAWFDEAGLHHAFSHGHHPIDYLFEEDIVAGMLSDQYAILYINVVYLSGNAYQKIRAWVVAGGTVILGQNGATHDEYAQPVAAPWTNVAFGPPQSGSAQINWQSTNLTTLSTRSTRAVTGDGTVLAAFSSGTAAALEIPIGSGRVIAVGFEPGTTYLNVGKVSGGPFPWQFTTSFQTGMRSILLGIATNMGLDSMRPVWTDDPLVEVSRLDHPIGGAAILLNYNNEPVHNLQIRLPDVSGWVQSQAQQISLLVKPDAANPTVGVVRLDLNDIDVLTWGSPSLVTETANARAIG